MGNEQSVPGSRRAPNKLSKPRTINNHSCANLLNPKSASQSRRQSIVSTSASPMQSRHSSVPVTVPAADDQKEEGQQTKRRRSLFRSKSAQPNSQRQDAESAVENSNPPSPQVSRRWSRLARAKGSAASESGEAAETGGEMRPPLPRNRMSLSQPYCPTNPRLSLVAEMPPPTPNQAGLIQRLSGYEEGEATAMSRPLPESQLYVPIRRRSLLQHGVATRRGGVEEVQPSFPPRYNHPEIPPSRIQAPHPPLEFSPGPRVATPTESDYGHIGAFKLGSLRITNGAASPSPSLEPSLRRAATMGQEEDHMMAAGDARGSPERCSRPGRSQRSNTISVATENKKPWTVRTESPLRQEIADMGEPTPLRETQLEWNQGEQSQKRPAQVLISLTIDIPDPSLAFFNFSTIETSSRPIDSPARSLELAHEYQQDLASSPFSFDDSPPVSPSLQVMSKDMAVDDDFFAPEPLTPVLSESFLRSFDPGHEGDRTARTVKGPRDLTPTPLAKADSGYSSNVSLRSFTKESAPASVEGPPPAPPKDTIRVVSNISSEELSSMVPSSTCPVVSTGSQTALRTQRSLPALPTDDHAPAQLFEHPPPVPLKHTKSQQAVRKPDPMYPSTLSPQLIFPPRDSRRKSNPSNDEQSPPDNPSTSSRWTGKKLNKRHESIQPSPVYTVQAFRSYSEQFRIPAPSAEAQRKLEERVDRFPVVSIPNTYVGQLGLRCSSSKETMGTIFSVGSAEVREELSFARLQSSLPAVPTQPRIPEDPTNLFHGEFGAKETDRRSYDNALPPLPGSEKDLPPARVEYNRRNTHQAPLPLPPPETRTRKSMLPTTRERHQSSPPLPAESESHLTSFDGVPRSLGRSPHDAAHSASRSTASAKQDRAKSMTADTAERFALQRSVSQESMAAVLRSRKSYDSIANGQPYLEPESRNERGRLAPAHTRFHAMKRQSSPSLLASFSTGRRDISPANDHVGEPSSGVNEDADDQRRVSTLSSLSKKTRSPPPVSMTTQRKVTPNPVGAHAPIPVARASNRTYREPKPAPARESEERGPPTTSWAEQRKSAGEAALKLQTRKSVEMQHRRQQPDVPTKPDLRSMESLDAYTYRQQLAVQEAQKPDQRSRKIADGKTYGDSGTGNGEHRQRPSAGHNLDPSPCSNARTAWNVGVGYDPFASNPDTQPSWVDGNMRATMAAPPHSRSQEYDHTYGSIYYNQEIVQHEYYDQVQPSPSEQSARLPELIHRRKTSTSEMLVLDRFSGGLDYGYESRRDKVRGDELYSVEFSGMPLFLQRADIRG